MSDGSIFECDGVQYRLSLVVPLNQTHRATEPKFQIKCQELSLGSKIGLGIYGALMFFVFLFPIILLYFAPFHFERLMVVYVNCYKTIRNLCCCCWREPLPYTPWPTRERPKTTNASVSSSSSRSNTPVLPLTTPDGPDYTMAAGSAPQRRSIAWIKSMFSGNNQKRQQQPATSETATTEDPANTWSSGRPRTTESTLRDTTPCRDAEIAMPVRSTTYRRNTDETLPAYRM